MSSLPWPWGSPRCIACQCSALRDGLNTKGLKTAAMPAVRNMFCSNNIHERIVASTAVGIHGLIYGRFGIGNEAIGPRSLVRFVSY